MIVKTVESKRAPWVLSAWAALAACGTPSAGPGHGTTPTAGATDPQPERKSRWDLYYDRQEARSPRGVLLEAIAAFAAEGREIRTATDAGCGVGIEARHLLAQGVAVYAFDAEPAAIERLRKAVEPGAASRLRTDVATFRDADWGADVDLVFAGYALPFAAPEHFPEIWRELVGSIAVGGRFVGHLFGDRDDWAKMPDRTHHTRKQAEALFDGFEIELFRVIEHDKPTASGHLKHWHVFEIIARKTE